MMGPVTSLCHLGAYYDIAVTENSGTLSKQQSTIGYRTHFLSISDKKDHSDSFLAS
jgi:hypothetical protein